MNEMEIIQAGFNLGYYQPDQEPNMPLAEPGLSLYRTAVQAGREARAEFDAAYTGPSIGPEIPGGITWEEYQKELGELLEPLFHKHMPHTEIPEYEPLPPPPMNVPR